jgi:4'-phosphopantetheinyl transferase
VADIAAALQGSAMPWLGSAERARLSAITRDSRRLQFVAGRWLARTCLAAWAGGAAIDYVLSAGDDEAPRVLCAPSSVNREALYFSLSHSGDAVACVVAWHPVGVDIERSDRDRDFQGLGAWIHDAAALQAWAELPADVRQAAFYAQWSLKEAWLKQSGPGPTRPAMSNVKFERCDGVEADAIVMQDACWTLGVYPARPAQLAVHGSLPGTSTFWKASQDPAMA